jgi:hypothetical protein
MDWYVVLVIFDIFLVYWITEGLWQLAIHVLSIENIEYYDWPAFVRLLPHASMFAFYLTWMEMPEIKALRTWSGWNYFRDEYFCVERVNEYVKQSKDEQVIYAMAPHGVYGLPAHVEFVFNERHQNVVTIGTSLLFWIPILREFACMTGVRPATSGSIIGALDEGCDLALFPAGLRDVLHHNDPNGFIKVLRGETKEGSAPRSGFIRCAMASKNRDNIVVCPIYVEGIRDAYTVINLWPWMQSRLLHKWYYPFFLLVFGKWGTFFPRPVKLTYRYGEPVRLVKGAFEKFVDEIEAASK